MKDYGTKDIGHRVNWNCEIIRNDNVLNRLKRGTFVVKRFDNHKKLESMVPLEQKGSQMKKRGEKDG
ncbi:hypothetical protein UB32_12430 [Mesobacillus subterraneus]|uniref:Uncharacterized protein n=1 Tax=Mesobacillus subterraneus TaxID=285983 RepID=A0A0D6ZAU8_9BACI|nr:hypothetical protein UB32_12430 [Mesobacillus subterraneus]